MATMIEYQLVVPHDKDIGLLYHCRHFNIFVNITEFDYFPKDYRLFEAEKQ